MRTVGLVKRRIPKATFKCLCESISEGIGELMVQRIPEVIE